MTVRFAVLAIVAAIFFVLGLSDGVYELTSPPSFSLHIVVRKCYSVVAFAIVGWLYARAVRPERPRTATAIAVAAYSAALEVAQKLHGSGEGFDWEAFDTLCGAFGGYLGASAWLMRGSRASSRR